MLRTQSLNTNPLSTTIFVEDELCKQYLSEIWKKDLTLLNIVCAGSKDRVISLTSFYLEQEQSCWGIVDRDFNWDNKQNPNHIFVLDKHEIENYLLDPEAIYESDFNILKKTSRRKSSISDIDNAIRQFTIDKRMWFASCFILFQIRRRLNSVFPKNPAISKIEDIESIIHYIENSDLIKRIEILLNEINGESLKSFVSKNISIIDKIYSDSKAVDLFPGKQVFMHIKSTLPGTSYIKSSAIDLDLAKQIGRFQYQNNSIPQEFLQIRDRITSR